MTTAFATGTDIHAEHLTLYEDLLQLDRGLNHLECYSEVFANLAGVEEVKDLGRRLVAQLPDHFKREEQTVLAAAAQVSPELAEICRELKSEHVELTAWVSAFGTALERFETSDDLEQAICQLKGAGRELTSYLRRHVAKEEDELSGFL